MIFSRVKGWMDGYFVYRRSTLKGHIASNKIYYMMILFNEKLKISRIDEFILKR